MDRRKSLQTLILGTDASALAFYGCKTDGSEQQVLDESSTPNQDTLYFGRTLEELERISKLQA